MVGIVGKSKKKLSRTVKFEVLKFETLNKFKIFLMYEFSKIFLFGYLNFGNLVLFRISYFDIRIYRETW